MSFSEVAERAEWYALVADDDDDMRALVVQALRGAQLKGVSEACDGDELLERYGALRALKELKLLVISDIGMPGTDGIAATQRLRMTSSELPIVLVTGFRDERTLADARDAGADAVLSKPVNAAALLQALATIVDA